MMFTTLITKLASMKAKALTGTAVAGAALMLAAPAAQEFWITPIETVSESEDGFERIYQGSQIIAVWPVELSQGAEWKCRLGLKIESPRQSVPATPKNSTVTAAPQVAD